MVLTKIILFFKYLYYFQDTCLPLALSLSQSAEYLTHLSFPDTLFAIIMWQKNTHHPRCSQGAAESGNGFAGQHLAMNLCSHKPIHITRGIIRWLYLCRHSEQDNPNLVLSLAHKSIGSNRLPCNPSLSTALRKLPVRNIMAKILWLNANLGNAQGYSKKSCIKLLSV